jgi:hypothetical protein
MRISWVFQRAFLKVYIRSKNQSMLTITAYMPVMGTLTLWAIMTVKTSEELGIGVVPMLASVESRQMMT